MIQPERIKHLNSRRSAEGEFVLYWMQAAQRSEWNHALEYSIRQGNELSKPLIAFFGLTESFPGANERHYAFMLEGLKETGAALRSRGIRMIVRRGSPETGVLGLARRAALVVVDDGYLRIQRKWRTAVAAKLECPLVEVATNVIVPVTIASPKEEYSAATFRPKIYKHLDRFLISLAMTAPRKKSPRIDPGPDDLDIRKTEDILASLSLDRGARRVTHFRGGASEAGRRLTDFVENRLPRYAEERNDPSRDALSHLSPYVHFGQISPLQIALQARKGGRHGLAPFLEELIVRRELGVNFVFYNRLYDRFNGLPEWCRMTLLEHEKDPRNPLYRRGQLEAARTHDPYWNAAQKEMVLTGKMHGYMRMYWGKKILEWSASPRGAFRTALDLNDRYELDGRDPNGFTGIAWCFGKHDRPWARRPVFGTIRTMSAAGLARKFDIDAYVRKIEGIAEAASGSANGVKKKGS